MKKTLVALLTCISTISFGQFDAIVNGDFETWEDRYLYDTPQLWKSSNTEAFFGTSAVNQSSDAYAGLSSAEISIVDIAQDPFGGYVFHGDLGVSGPEGGIPYGDNFEAISFAYKGGLAAGDTLFMLLIRFNNSAMVDFQVIPAAYGTTASWTPNLLFVGNITHDELFIGFFMGNPLTGSGASTVGSWARIDEISLLAGGVPTTPLPNAGFEDWTTGTTEEPVSWYSLNYLLTSYGLENVLKTTDANTGAFAVEMETVLLGTDTVASFLSIGAIDIWSPIQFENIAYSGSPVRISGAYKYAPVNGDQAVLQIRFFESGLLIGAHTEAFTPQASYATFDELLTIAGTPDSISIIAHSGNMPGSILKLDDLEFLTADASNPEGFLKEFEFYPNPASNVVHIVLPEYGSNQLRIYAYDGKEVFSLNDANGFQVIDTRAFPAGMYLITLQNGEESFSRKLIIE